MIFDQSPVSIQTKFKSKLLSNFYKMSGKIIESCFICSSHAPRSSCYNVQIGYSTFYCCTIECNTVVNAFFYARSHYKWACIENIEKAVEHYCKSTKCRASSYNLNMSLIKRVCTYFWEVRISKRQYNKEYLDSLYNYLLGDEWSQEDPFDSEYYSDDLP